MSGFKAEGRRVGIRNVESRRLRNGQDTFGPEHVYSIKVLQNCIFYDMVMNLTLHSVVYFYTEINTFHIHFKFMAFCVVYKCFIHCGFYGIFVNLGPG